MQKERISKWGREMRAGSRSLQVRDESDVVGSDVDVVGAISLGVREKEDRNDGQQG